MNTSAAMLYLLQDIKSSRMLYDLMVLCCRITVEVWNKLAELASQQLDKGVQIQVCTSLL